MTREQAKANLVTLGVEEPTDEQITHYLNQIGGETKRYSDRADKLKADADKVAELQKQLDDLNNANLTEVEKANKDREDALNKVANLEKEIKKMQTMKALADKGIIGEDAESFFNEDGSVNFDTLGKIISERETKASAEKEKELLNGTPNPSGSSGGTDTDSKSADVLNAEQLNFGSPSVDANTKDYYVLKRN